MGKKTAASLTAAMLALVVLVGGCIGTPPGTKRAANGSGTAGTANAPNKLGAGTQPKSASLPGAAGDRAPAGQAGGTAAGGTTIDKVTPGASAGPPRAGNP